MSSCRVETRNRTVALEERVHDDVSQTMNMIFILLSTEVGRNPPC